jgi:hypothetical protein
VLSSCTNPSLSPDNSNTSPHSQAASGVSRVALPLPLAAGTWLTRTGRYLADHQPAWR